MKKALLLLLLALTGRAEPLDLPKLSQQYQQLRAIKGHFQGGQWCDEVDRWAGRKHQVMADLGEALGKPGTPEEEVIRWLGPADEKTAQQGGYRLIYCWRGHHDYLYFLCQNQRVLSSGWWMAGE